MIKIAGFIFIACLIVAYVLFATPSETTCVLQIQPYHVSTAVPLVVFHKNKTLSGLRVGEKATIGLEYIAEAGIPEVYANELRKHSDVLAAFSVADLIAGSNLLPAEHIEDTLSPMTLVLPHTTTKANYVSIIGMIIESNDAYALGTVSLKDTKIVEAIVYDAGTEKNAPCLSFLEDEQGAIGAGCPSLNSGQYDMIYNGTTTDELIHRHTTFTEPAFSITPQCTQSSIEENEFTIIPYFGISTKNKTETIAFDILRMPKDTFAIGIFHNDATAFAPQTLQTQLTTLFATGNSDTFVKSIQSIQQEVVVQVLMLLHHIFQCLMLMHISLCILLINVMKRRYITHHYQYLLYLVIYGDR